MPEKLKVSGNSCQRNLTQLDQVRPLKKSLLQQREMSRLHRWFLITMLHWNFWLISQGQWETQRKVPSRSFTSPMKRVFTVITPIVSTEGHFSLFPGINQVFSLNVHAIIIYFPSSHILLLSRRHWCDIRWFRRGIRQPQTDCPGTDLPLGQNLPERAEQLWRHNR